ncbi:MAG TPA: NAD(P)-binding domain-containing protein [Bacteroidia bacterium]|nr:NAD(P)-binding domain-containing protein [Bacteroidia bacterium]
MKIGVLGTGMVGNTIAGKMIQLGHEVKMGSRSATNEKAAEWVKSAGKNASAGTFADAAAFGEIIFNCTKGDATMEVLKLAGEKNLGAKLFIDISNPLDFSKGFPPTLTICNDDSLGETIQRTYPSLKVVKTLNTMNCLLMVNPSLVPGEHNVFLSGNDADAKAAVKKLLGEIGWTEKSMIDVGDITTCRGVEQLLPIWVRLYGAFGSPNFNFHIAR